MYDQPGLRTGPRGLQTGIAAELRIALITEIARIERQTVTIAPGPPVRDRGRFPETTVRRLKLDGRRLE